MRSCLQCLAVLPVGAFYRNGAGTPTGRCKQCLRLNAREYRQENAAAIKARDAARYRANVAGESSYKRKLTYGTDGADLLAAQKGICAVCAVDLSTLPPKNRHLDHCHQSKTIRGWLCSECNLGIGRLKDDPARLRAAADYIERKR